MSEVDVVELLKELVSIPSVNPDHTDQADIANEFRLSGFLAEYLESRGFTLSWDDYSPERASLIASFGPSDPKHTILFEAHTDTVGVSDMVIPPFDPVVKDGRLYGRGSCDTKGPMAAALAVLTPNRLDALKEAGIRVLFVGAFGEEKGNLGAERLVDQGLTAESVIILEPTGLELVHAHKGAAWFRLTLIGEAAHGSDPDRGINAIMAMCDVMQWLNGEMKQLQEGMPPNPLGTPTLNVGQINGGIAPNIVPHKCVVEVDRRLVSGEEPETVIGGVRQYLEVMKKAGRIRDFAIEVIKIGHPFVTPTDSPLLTRMKAACMACGREGRLATAAWYSDAGAFSRNARDVVVFGPGHIRQAHTVDEYIELAELKAGVDILSQLMDSFLLESASQEGIAIA